MGEVVGRRAAVEDIFVDVRATHAKATARGGEMAAIVEERLGPAVGLMDQLDARHRQAEAIVKPLVIQVEVQDRAADLLLGKVSDTIWNEVGRPRDDVFLSLMFPGGIAYYAEGSDDEQPDRMDLLVELLESNVHPKLPKEKALEQAQLVREASGACRVAVDALRPARARLDMLVRARAAVARVCQIALVNTKRVLKASGFTEADIHTVIPDRP